MELKLQSLICLSMWVLNGSVWHYTNLFWCIYIFHSFWHRNRQDAIGRLSHDEAVQLLQLHGSDATIRIFHRFHA